MATDSRFPCLLFAFIVALAAGCSGGGGGGGTSTVIISGQVLAPAGQIADNTTSDLFERLLHSILPTARAEISGLAPVADGTVIDLIRIDANGAETSLVASTTTSGGTYRFNLTKLGIGFSSDLVLRANGFGGARLRAFAARATANINPVSEASLRLALEQIGLTAGADLSRLTVDEIKDLTDSVSLVGSLSTIPGGGNIEDTVTDLITLVKLDPGIMTFIQAAVGAGQTSIGTGDVGNLFPLEQGNIWNRLIDDSTLDTPYLADEEISGTKLVDEVLATILLFHNYDNTGTTLEEYDAETSTGVTYLGGNDPTDPISSQLAPFRTINYPIAPGIVQTLLDRNGVTYPEDLDADGINEKYDASVTVSPVDTEAITVQAGTFPRALHVDTRIDVTVHLSNLSTNVNVFENLSQWLSPGVGVVKQSLEVSNGQYTDTTAEQLLGYRVNGIGKGVLPKFTIAGTLAAANSDTTHPGRAAIATDNTHYLAVTCRDAAAGSPNGLIGVLVSDHRTVGAAFHIANHNTCQFPSPSVAFNGSNYLVSYARDGAIYGTLVSPNGNVGSEVMISPDTSSNFAPSVASSGNGFLVAWQRFESSNYEIRGALVSAGGTAGGQLDLFTATGEQVSPAVTFNGSDYVVAWRDTRDGSGPSQSTDIYATRVGTDGSIKDPGGIAVATAAGFQGAPQVASDGTNVLVVWVDAPLLGVSPLQGATLYAKLIDASGNLVGNTATDRGITLNASSYDGKDSYAAIFDGAKYLIAWSVGSFNNSPPAGIYATRLSTDGTLLDTATTDVGMIMSGPPGGDAAKYVQPALAANETNAFLLWLNNNELAGQSKSIEGAYFYP